jgi:hypothetical protein
LACPGGEVRGCQCAQRLSAADRTKTVGTLALSDERAEAILGPEVRALDRGALPEIGAVPHDLTPNIPHHVIDLPPAGDHPITNLFGGSHELPTVVDHPLPPRRNGNPKRVGRQRIG